MGLEAGAVMDAVHSRGDPRRALTRQHDPVRFSGFSEA
jgi:hypothetical protein